MAENEVATTSGDNLLASNEVPSYLQNFQGKTGTEDLQQYVRPKFLKVVQKSGKTCDRFTPGTVLKMPGEEVFMEKDGVCLVTPVFHFKQWGIWYHNKANTPYPVKERTLDPTSEIAKICMSFDKTKMEVPDPEHPGLPLIYKESLVYLLYRHDTKDVVAVSFQGGEHKTGRAFGELIARRGETSPLCAGVYSMKVSTHHDRAKTNSWPGLDFDNQGWCDQELFNLLYKKFEEFDKNYKDRMLIVDADENDDSSENTNSKVVASGDHDVVSDEVAY